MPRQRKDGPRREVRKLKDGSTVVYLYDRVTRALLGKECATVAPLVQADSMAALILAYRASNQFKTRMPRTRETYGSTLDFLGATFGDMKIRSFTPVVILEFKESLSAQPSKFNGALALLSILFKLAMSQGTVHYNPAAGIGKLEVRARIEVWSREEETRYVAYFRPRLKLLFMLMLYTCQRLSDVLKMTLNQVQEHQGRLYITLRQSKTDELVGIPVHDALAVLLRQRLAEDVTIPERGTDRQLKTMLLVPSPRGREWSRRNASRAWDHDLADADVKLAAELKARGWVQRKVDEELAQRHRQRRDLRRTGIVRMAEGGATTPQIAAVSGHQIDYCQRIIDTYLPRRTEVALGGIEAWEASEKKGPRVVRLSDETARESEAQSRRDRGGVSTNETTNGQMNGRATKRKT
jgi:integrase